MNSKKRDRSPSPYGAYPGVKRQRTGGEDPLALASTVLASPPPPLPLTSGAPVGRSNGTSLKSRSGLWKRSAPRRLNARILVAEEIDGEALELMTEEKFKGIGIPGGPSSKLFKHSSSLFNRSLSLDDLVESHRSDLLVPLTLFLVIQFMSLDSWSSWLTPKIAFSLTTDLGAILTTKLSHLYGADYESFAPPLEYAALLSLTGQKILPSRPLPGGHSLNDAERGGYIFFIMSESANDPSVQVHMPFIQLKRLNEALQARNQSFFPNQLLFFPTDIRPWRWQDFEILFPYFLSSLLRAVAIQKDSSNFTLQSTLRGAVASSRVLKYPIVWESVEVHLESRKLLKVAGVVEVKSRILCKDSLGHKIYDGVFICEVKHSEWTVEDSSIAFSSIKAWYDSCQWALSPYRSTYLVVLVVVTKARWLPLRPLYPLPRSGLRIWSSSQGTFLGPLAHRGLLASNDG